MPSPYSPPEPTEETARRSLERVLGPARADEVWARACSTFGFSSPPALTGPQLRQVAAQLALQADFVGVLGKALLIRIETYEALSGTSWLPAEASV